MTISRAPRRSVPLEHFIEQNDAQRRYGMAVAIAIVLAATLLRLVIFSELGTRAAFVTFYPALMLAALYGGLRAVAGDLPFSRHCRLFLDGAGRVVRRVEPNRLAGLGDLCRQRLSGVVGRRETSSVQHPAASSRGFPPPRT